jgi:glucokinase
LKRIVLVNGVPASGKSAVADLLAQVSGWPIIALDTIKEALFDHLGIGDRLYSRKLGQASYQAMFDIIRDCPDGVTAIADAWFGFQPVEVLRDHLVRACVSVTAEVWCQAPPATIAERYRARAASRHPGHLGADYAHELEALTRRAGPLRIGAVIACDTTRPVDGNALYAAVVAAFEGIPQASR